MRLLQWGMPSRADFVAELTDETTVGYDEVLDPDALAELHELMHDSLELHPELSLLVGEHAPREAVEQSAEVLAGSAIEQAAASAGKKQHG